MSIRQSGAMPTRPLMALLVMIAVLLIVTARHRGDLAAGHQSPAPTEQAAS